MKWGFWLRWSWRDLRARWLQVLAVGLIIALGTGIFSGLGGQKTWRIESQDLSYERLKMFDLRIQLADGSYLEDNALRPALADIEGIATLETRLITPTLVDASHDTETILVTGRIVGVDVAEGGPHVSRLYIEQGRELTMADSGQTVAVVEYKFADHYGLQPGDPIRISGDIALDFIGAGYTPEYFQVIPDNGAFMAEGSLAIIFVPLATAQKLAAREGLINDVVIRLAPDANQEVVQTAIESRMAEVFANTGITLTTKQDDPVYKSLYLDAENDQTIWDLVALLFLIGAALGTFNLAGRMVEAQRRQIGISMALGVPRQWIALRPLLVGVQIAALGTLFGLGFGVLFSQVFGSLMKELIPLPEWKITFYVPAFLKATALGIVLPVAATLLPVWRAVRVQPLDAIRSGYLVAKGGGLSKVANYLPIPGRSFMQMPFRNILRSPWRTLLTALGISMAVILLTMFVGFLDTFEGTLTQAEDALLYRGADRTAVNLDFFYPVDSERIQNLMHLTDETGQPLFRQAEPNLTVGGKLIGAGKEIETLLGFYDMQNAIWVPAVLEGSRQPGSPGLIISAKAAQDLGVQVGDRVTLEHPRREGLFSFRFVRTDMTVIAIHDNPLRGLTYLDSSNAASMGLSGVANRLIVTPAPGVSRAEIKQALFTQPGVTSVEVIAEIPEAFEELLALFTTFLRVIQGIVIFMAFLIAFNSTSINVDERSREIATMFAFGLPIRTVTRMQMVENCVIGILGTVLGIGLGWIVLNEVLAARVEEQLADFKLIVALAPMTVVVSLLLGVLTVALTPLFSIRRMLKMDIPATLRVME